MQESRAFAVKVEGKRLPVSLFSGLLKGCKGHKTHRFENGGTNQIRKTGKREVVFLQPLPQTLYLKATWKEDIRLPGKGISNSHGARPVEYDHSDD